MRVLGPFQMALLSVIRLLVPSRERDEWRREWDGELSALDERVSSWPDQRPRLAKTVLRVALHDALWLRLHPRKREMRPLRRRPLAFHPPVADPNIPLASVWRRDLVFGLRRLRRSPAFSLMVIIFVGLSIAAATTVFALVRSIALEPLAYTDSERLFRLVGFDAAKGQQDWLAKAEVDMLRTRADTFEKVAYSTAFPGTWQTDDGRQKVQRGYVSADYFGLLGIRALHGRLLGEGDSDESSVVLSHDFWRRRWHSDPGVVGRSLIVDDRPVTVVGVALPSTYTHDLSTPAADLWLRFPPPRPNDDVDFRIFTAIGRLKPGAEIEAARAEVSTLEAGLSADRPAVYGGWEIQIEALKDSVVGTATRPLFLLLLSLGLLLLGISANLANVVMARLFGRRNEVLIHVALGGRRTAIARQLAIEGALLSLVGCLVGLSLASGLLDTLVLWLPFELPRAAEVRLGWQAPAFAVAAALCMTLLFAWLPALIGTRAGLAQDLKGGGRSSTSHLGWLRQTMIAAQVALALPLLAVASVLVGSLSGLQAADLGLRTAGLVSTPVSLSFRAYPEPARRHQFFQAVIDHLRSQPGVISAAATLQTPVVAKQADRTRFKVVGGEPTADRPRALHQVVTAGYFETIGARLIEGRDFTVSDRADGEPVVVISETLRLRHFPERSPVGQRLEIELAIAGEANTRTIIGVVGDIAQFGPAAPVEPMVFLPHSQVSWPAMMIVARTEGPAPPLLQALRAEVLRLDPTAIVEAAEWPSRALEVLLWPYRSAAMAIGGFGIFAAALCLLGLYGLLSYDVEQSARESAIRMAIGASGNEIRSRFLRRAGRLLCAGTVAGMLAAWAAIHMLRSAVEGIGDLNPASLTLAPLFLIAVAFVASWLPASRAASISLATTLRSD